MIKHRPKAVELALVQAGYTLADIRGERVRTTTTTEPQGLLAAVGLLTPRVATAALAGVVALGLIWSAQTGLLGPLSVSVALGLGLYWLGQVDVEATETQHVVERPGMERREVQERLTQWDEWQRIRQEQQEQEARRAERQARAGGH